MEAFGQWYSPGRIHNSSCARRQYTRARSAEEMASDCVYAERIDFRGLLDPQDLAILCAIVMYGFPRAGMKHSEDYVGKCLCLPVVGPPHSRCSLIVQSGRQGILCEPVLPNPLLLPCSDG